MNRLSSLVCREAAEKAMNATGQEHVNMDSLFQVSPKKSTNYSQETIKLSSTTQFMLEPLLKEWNLSVNRFCHSFQCVIGKLNICVFVSHSLSFSHSLIFVTIHLVTRSGNKHPFTPRFANIDYLLLQSFHRKTVYTTTMSAASPENYTSMVRPSVCTVRWHSFTFFPSFCTVPLRWTSDTAPSTKSDLWLSFKACHVTQRPEVLPAVRKVERMRQFFTPWVAASKRNRPLSDHLLHTTAMNVAMSSDIFLFFSSNNISHQHWPVTDVNIVLIIWGNTDDKTPFL